MDLPRHPTPKPIPIVRARSFFNRHHQLHRLNPILILNAPPNLFDLRHQAPTLRLVRCDPHGVLVPLVFDRGLNPVSPFDGSALGSEVVLVLFDVTEQCLQSSVCCARCSILQERQGEIRDTTCRQWSGEGRYNEGSPVRDPSSASCNPIRPSRYGVLVARFNDSNTEFRRCCILLQFLFLGTVTRRCNYQPR
ncbi:hypothetical protein BDZ97DRAFT_75572 [Flammula alnicola]|nr:hypothetical protein BDZ97DRAFT_75572 [Flammula alnicola]